jgi:chemotaxis family two-component system sensor kinase Cph1
MPDRPIRQDEIRRRAEDMLIQRGAATGKAPATARDELIHELEVRQIELEMQNEELQRAQIELENSRAKYFSLFDLAPIGYFTISEKGMVLEANLTGAALLGVERRDLITCGFSAYVAKGSLQQFYSYWKQVFESRATESCELRLRKGDGSEFYAHLTSDAVEDSDGYLRSCRMAVTDISEHRRILDELARANEELGRSNAELERYAHLASHDLKEPLRMVCSFLQLLERRHKPSLRTEEVEFIDYAVKGAKRMEALVDGLLEYSRVGATNRAFKPTECNQVLDRTLANLKVAIEESQAIVTHRPLPRLVVDGVQIAQVFQNLIGNAIKFRRQGEVPRIDISATPRALEWVFSVRDNGIGIDPEHKDRIFVISQSLHSWEDYPGTGMGLAICKKIVERHGGKIWVESEPGEGSTFYFTIPAGPEASAAAQGHNNGATAVSSPSKSSKALPVS